MTKSIKTKNKGFTLEITPEIADILGVTEQNDLYIIVKGDEVILKAKKVNPELKKKRQEDSRKLTQRLIKEFSPVLKKLAKT